MCIRDSVIRKAISKLKKEKSDPYTELTTECFKEGPEILMILLSHFFQACLIHEYLPDSLLIAKMIPLLKDSNGDISSMDNYRSISLSSIFLKIWDFVILILYGEKLDSGSMQFGFQAGSGTELCTWTLLEAVDFYVNRGSKAYVCLLYTSPSPRDQRGSRMPSSA